MSSFAKFFKESTIAILERIKIKGIGEFDAKVDSGNTQNVLHGTNIKCDGDYVHFITEYGDKFKALNACKDNSHPCVYLDIKVKDKIHKGVPFEIADRTENAEKCVLGIQYIKPLEQIVSSS